MSKPIYETYFEKFQKTEHYEKAKLSATLPGSEAMPGDLNLQMSLEIMFLGGWNSALEWIPVEINKIRTSDKLLEAHRRFHSKVACPGKDECEVCMLESQGVG